MLKHATLYHMLSVVPSVHEGGACLLQIQETHGAFAGGKSSHSSVLSFPLPLVFMETVWCQLSMLEMPGHYQAHGFLLLALPWDPS